MFDEEFNKVHGFSAVLRPPIIGGISETANGTLSFGDENHTQVGTLQEFFVDAACVACSCARVPLVQQFFGELAHPWYVSSRCRADTYRWCFGRSHLVGHCRTSIHNSPKRIQRL